MAEYDPSVIEPKWQVYWEKNKSFKVGKPGGKKLYCLDMFPYPSGAGLHVGHPLGYTATDIYSRFRRMQGYSVLHPMGFDAFGLPAEQHAVQTGEHPSVITMKNCEVFSSQMKSLGLSYDWDRNLATCTPDYYQWTQLIFIKLFNSWFDDESQKARPIDQLPIPDEIRGQGVSAVEQYRAGRRLAYYADGLVNWCPALGTVLANEEVIDGKSERGGHDVLRKPMKQWFLRITKYAERLLNELNEIDWPENIKEQQRNWIGRKTGAEIVFPIKGHRETVTCFTTRPDTLFGVTFFVLSPEHPLVDQITSSEHRKAVEDYRAQAMRMSEMVRTVENRKKTGVFTGAYVINPINQESVPLYVGDYVLMSFGTGAVMGVPSHDERDFDFARTFQIEIRPVIAPADKDESVRRAVVDGEMAWTDAGLMLPCASSVAQELALQGKDSRDAGALITKWLAEHEMGREVVNYKLRDWLFSRQRYWGEPIPVIHWENGRVSAVDEADLPLELPRVVDYMPSESGESPLAKVTKWLEVTDPKTGLKGKRETNTMPQWAGSCWYYLRFIDPQNEKTGWDRDLEKAWMPVDLYVGGAEHAVLHLLYARFWHKVLYDLGHVSTKEPFQRLFNQGMIQAYAYKNKRGALVPVDEVEESPDGIARHAKNGDVLERIIAKMSKSLRNVVRPDEIVKQYGADTFRMYLMFMGPLESSHVWDPKAITGVHRFLKKAWALVRASGNGTGPAASEAPEREDVLKALHRLIKKITVDIECLRFNTAVSAMMEFVNAVGDRPVCRETLEKFVLVLSPFAPHLGEELWSQLGHRESLACHPWPVYHEKYLTEDIVTVVVQVAGRKRALVEVSPTVASDELRETIIRKMAATNYPVAPTDQFITVFQSGTQIPRLVNVVRK